MTVASSINRSSFSGNGVTTAFSFPYFFTAKSDMKVYGIDALGNVTLYALTTDYTIAGTQAANLTYPSGGTITMNSAPAAGVSLTIVRIPDFLQSTHWVDADPDPAAVKELAFDKLTLEVQRLKDQVSRAILLHDGYAGLFNPQMPAVVPANSTLVTSADGLSMTFGSAIGSQGTVSLPKTFDGSTALAPLPGVAIQTWFVSGTSGAINMNGLTPQIGPGTVIGQRLVLIGVDTTNTLEFVTGQGLILNGFYILVNGSTIELLWDGTNWREMSRNEL